MTARWKKKIEKKAITSKAMQHDKADHRFSEIDKKTTEIKFTSLG